MSLEKNMKEGKLYQEYGHQEEEDIAYEKTIKQQRIRCKELIFEFNHTSPSKETKRQEILEMLLAKKGKDIFMEGPIYFAYGKNTKMGKNVYANFNLMIIDDGQVTIGDNVMFAPNVIISTTGHPIDPSLRTGGTQFSLPVTIEDNVWIGAGVVILPGVTIKKNSVIGAGSVVTKDIDEDCIAFGNPCVVKRKISDYDKQFYARNRSVNFDW